MKFKSLWIVPALLLAFGLSACFPYHSKIPGVLDLRSDGMSAEPAPLPEEVRAEKVGGAPRDGFEGFFLGQGMQSYGSKIMIEDRTYWLFWVIPMFNKSVAEEVANASRGQALRQVHLQQEEAINDVIIVYGAQFLNMVPAVGSIAAMVAAVLTPSQTISLSGVRIQAGPTAQASAATQEKAQGQDITETSEVIDNTDKNSEKSTNTSESENNKDTMVQP